MRRGEDHKREAWVLRSFIPLNDEERARLDLLRDELSFDPCEEPKRLNDKRGGLRDPKRVVDALTNGDPGRERACWEETPLDVLRERGEGVGLDAYLEDVASRLAPLLGAAPPKAGGGA
jgi:hypothetical protein